jgi:hypothetical protein
MNGSQPRMNGRCSLGFSPVRRVLFSWFIPVILVHSPLVHAQNATPSAAVPAAWPIEFVHFYPSGVSVRVRNVSGKKIVGLTFNATLRDATEHWKWYHWYFDDNRLIREFGWNKVIKESAAKTLSWDRTDIDSEHGGGGAFVLTSALLEDGSMWEEVAVGGSCKYVWYNSHKESFVRPVQLPLRQ